MKKTSTLLILFLLTALNLFAQEKTRFGLKTGINLSWLSTDQGFSDRQPIMSMHFTGFTEVQLSEKLFMQPGLSLQGKGYRINANGWMDGPNGSTHMLYIEIPVNFLYQFKLPFANMIAGGGPYLGMGLWDKEKGGSGGWFADLPRGKGYDNTDYGLNLSLGTQLSSRFVLTLQQGIGLANIAPEAYTIPGPADGLIVVDDKIRNMVSSVSLGYRF